MNLKSKIALISAVIAVTFSLLVLSQMLFMLTGDVMAGALNGTPETGWGFLIAILSYLPLLAIVLVVYIAAWKMYKSNTAQPVQSWKLWAASVVIATSIVVTFASNDKDERIPESPKDATVTTAMRASSKLIVDQYRQKKYVLPTTSEFPGFTSKSITYSVVNESTYRFCGEFEVDTIPYYYDKKHPEAEGGYAKKVLEGSVFDVADTISIFSIHKKGSQCYKIGLTKPSTIND